MITDTQLKNRIFKRINRIPTDKLKEIDEFISKLEQKVTPIKRTLSFAGAWEDIDDTLFESFTKNLVSNRQKNRQRINE